LERETGLELANNPRAGHPGYVRPLSPEPGDGRYGDDVETLQQCTSAVLVFGSGGAASPRHVGARDE
jgi:hypothetical protein